MEAEGGMEAKGEREATPAAKLNKKESLASKGELGKAAAKSFGFRLTDGERDGASVVEGLGDDAWLHIFHHLHHIVHHGVSEGVGDFLLHQPGFYLTMLYGVGSSCAISHAKSARAEVYSAIIPDYYDKNISKLV